jgi:hypothetical protein
VPEGTRIAGGLTVASYARRKEICARGRFFITLFTKGFSLPFRQKNIFYVCNFRLIQFKIDFTALKKHG